MHVFSYYYNNLSQGKNRLSSSSWKCALVRDSSSHFVYISNLIKILEGKGKHSYSCWGPRHVYRIQGNNGLENSYWPIRISQVVMAKYCRSAAGTSVIHSRADPEGVWMNPPGHLRLHIICAYLAWSSNDFWPAEPSMTKILASWVVLKGAFTHLGKIRDPQIGSCCKLALTTGEYAWNWAWFRQSGRDFKFSCTLHAHLNQ